MPHSPVSIRVILADDHAVIRASNPALTPAVAQRIIDPGEISE